MKYVIVITALILNFFIWRFFFPKKVMKALHVKAGNMVSEVKSLFLISIYSSFIPICFIILLFGAFLNRQDLVVGSNGAIFLIVYMTPVYIFKSMFKIFPMKKKGLGTYKE